MPAPIPTMEDVKRACLRYQNGERPWPESFNSVDWFILFENQIYPLKYIYSLATNIPPITYSTGQIKRALKEMGLESWIGPPHHNDSEGFQNGVREALADEQGRRARLKTANPKPRITHSIVQTFGRNPDVVAEVLSRAKGHCECCLNPAPFMRASDGSPYLEVHHKVFLANGGDDTVENAEALCPICHRQKHYG